MAEYLAYGTRVYADLDGGGTPSYTELADVREVGAVNDEDRPAVNVTPLTPTIEMTLEVPGLPSAAEFTFKQKWTKARWTALKTPYDAKTIVHWKVVEPDNLTTPANATKHEFSGWLRKCVKDGVSGTDDVVTISCTVKLTTKVTSTEGS